MPVTRRQANLIVELRSVGNTWPETTRQFNDKFNTNYNHDALRLAYKRSIEADLVDLPDPDSVKELKKQRRAQLAASDSRKKLKTILESQIALEDIMKELRKVSNDINKLPKTKLKPLSNTTKKLTLEALIGDIQVGKIMHDYNSEICGKRMEEHGRAIIQRINQYHKQGYQVEKIILSCLGDMIESSHKHKNSMRATDVSNPEQMRLFVVYFCQHILFPLSKLGIKIDVNCVTGNHDHDDHGLQMFKPGREHLSWMFYNMIAEISKAAGLKHVKFNIPEGSFMVYDIYGHKVLIEHGVGVSVAEPAMGSKLNTRSRQIKDNITFFRMGDKHSVTFFNNGQYIVNGAYFGKDEKGIEYSGILGYHTPPAQVLVSYVERKKDDPRNPFYEAFIIQLEHIK